MKVWTLDEIVKATGGQSLSKVSASFQGFGTDTRKDLKGQVFIALRGENHDAHQFLSTAVQQGAAALLIDKPEAATEDVKSKASVILVKDTLKALQALGLFYRRQLKAKVVAITGSNGKTTSKEYCRSMLSAQFKVTASHGSFNNHWGVPLSILEANPDDDVLVLEMGMNHTGELAHLVQIGEPDITVVTMVGLSHLGELGTPQAIAKAKEELYLGSPESTAIFNLDNEHTYGMHERAGQRPRIITFSSFQKNTDISLRITKMDLTSIEVTGQIQGVTSTVNVPVFGRHNVTNLMVASSVALACGMTPDQIWKAMPRCKTHWGRSQVMTLQNGAKVLFDAYNANPDSMSVLIKNLFEMSFIGKKIAVLGEMLELGDYSSQLHTELGEQIGNTDVDVVWFMGPHAKDFKAGIERSAFSKTAIYSDSYEQKLATQVGSMISPSDVAVIKGSRGMKMERVLKVWDPSINLEK